jgi:hypothetical protein
LSAKVISLPIRKKDEPRVISVIEVIASVTADLLVDWQSAAHRNKLSEYVSSALQGFLPHHFFDTFNLSFLAECETKIGLYPAVFAPQMLANNQLGWVSGFHLKTGERVSTPEMVTENMARAFSIILFLKLKQEFQQLGI